MSYSQKQVEDMETERAAWLERADRLAILVVGRIYRSEDGRRFGTQGFGRRLRMLELAIEKVFDLIPPGNQQTARVDVSLGELLLQSFLMNVFGAIDNLAWIWASEREVRQPNGKPLERHQVAFFGRRADILLATLTPKARAGIEASAEWFRAIGSYRHGIAHQVPVYIPRTLTTDEAAEFERLTEKQIEALNARDYDRLNAARDAQFALGRYGTMMALDDRHRPIHFHPQMICDFATVVDLGQTLLDELGADAT